MFASNFNPIGVFGFHEVLYLYSSTKQKIFLQSKQQNPYLVQRRLCIGDRQRGVGNRKRPIESTIDQFLNLTLILPDAWKGKYALEKNGQNYIVYHLQVREGFGTQAAFDDRILKRARFTSCVFQTDEI